MTQPADLGYREIRRAAHAALPRTMAERVDGYVEAQRMRGAVPEAVAEAVVRAVWADTEQHYGRFADALAAERAARRRPSPPPARHPPSPVAAPVAAPVTAPVVPAGREAIEPRPRPGRVAALFDTARQWARRSLGRTSGGTDRRAPAGPPADRIRVDWAVEVRYEARSETGGVGPGPGADRPAGPGQSAVAAAAWAGAGAGPTTPAPRPAGRVETWWAAARAATGTGPQKRAAPRR
ncbi:hypothetical protein [Jidongwangia harbinensis]|uniref:hypothetical protein n=1 Tax=Jidongwangia harbinensis TaxID=2878561 RepID=UPI001CD9C27A|nr:hypothetical protein [Jidongwangia harbinensis]MCA2216003.1 hypothetical protein [Jidongwangia harbinensis]